MHRSGLEGLNNGMMAAAPGLPLWGTAAQVLIERLHASGEAAWETGPIFQTGPRVMGEARPLAWHARWRSAHQPTPASVGCNSPEVSAIHCAVQIR